MADKDDDIFKPKLGRIRNGGGARAKTYLNRVLNRISATGGKGFGATGTSRRFTGTRIGRGTDVMQHRRVGGRFGPTYRRVVIKSRIVRLAEARNGRGLAAARAHLSYIQRDAVSQENQPGQLYDAAGDKADGKSFLSRSDGDRHQFRFIVSPEDATELSDLKPFVRDLMGAMEDDLGTRLDWVAVDHFNTEHPHSHVVLRGKDELGKDLIIARDYISYGMRRKASEILTLELGPQTEQEIRQKLFRQVDQERFTDLDCELVRDAVDGIVNVQSNSRHADERFKQAMRAGRLRVLTKFGLAEEAAPGHWRLSPKLEETLRRTDERRDIIKTIHRGLGQAGLDAGIGEYSIYQAGDPRAQTITGRIIDRGLHDDLNDSPYITIDAADGRVHYVALDPRQDMEDLPVGAIVEVHPVAAGPKPSERIIVDVARENQGVYTPAAHHADDPRASTEYVEAHVRRLEALRRQNIVRRFPNGSWDIPDDFTERVSALAEKQARYPGRVMTLSYLSLEGQTTANGATWLDRQLLAKDQTPLRDVRFGAAVRTTLRQREDHLVSGGLARREGKTLRYQRDLLRVLRQREVAAAGKKLAKEMGLEFVEARDGERIEGIYKRPVQLASGKFAVIAKSKEFTLVPRRPVLELHRGKTVGGVMRGSSVSFDFSKQRGVAIG